MGASQMKCSSAELAAAASECAGGVKSISVAADGASLHIETCEGRVLQLGVGVQGFYEMPLPETEVQCYEDVNSYLLNSSPGYMAWFNAAVSAKLQQLVEAQSAAEE